MVNQCSYVCHAIYCIFHSYIHCSPYFPYTFFPLFPFLSSTHMCCPLDLCHLGHSGRRPLHGSVLAFVSEQRGLPGCHQPSPRAVAPGHPLWDQGGQSVRAKASRCHVRSAGSSRSHNRRSFHQATGRGPKFQMHLCGGSHLSMHILEKAIPYHNWFKQRISARYSTKQV